MTKTLLFAGLAVAAVASISSAQAAPADWSGLYVGVTGGGQSFGVDGSNDLDCTTACSYFNAVNTPPFQDAPSFSSSDAGSAFGVEAGWNAPMGSGMMWGIEGDISSSDFSSSETHGIAYVSAPANGLVYTNDLEADWSATIRLRAGLTAGNTLFYVTGGVAFADVTLKTDISEQVAGVVNCGICRTGSAEQSDTLTGWTLGAGAEWAWDPNWSIKFEYLYEDFGSISTDVDSGYNTDSFHTSADVNANVVRIGINYGF